MHAFVPIIIIIIIIIIIVIEIDAASDLQGHHNFVIMSAAKKHKRVVLSLEQKLEVLKLIDSSTSYTVICRDRE